VVIIRPYFANIGKRMVKTPKVYFTDVGTLCFLAGIREASYIAAGPLGGAIMEAAVLSEIMKAYMHRGEEARVYFWRTSTGVEVDLIVDIGMELIPIEVKLSSTPRPAMAKSIKIFKQDMGKQAGRGYVVHPGDVTLPLGDDITAIPFGEL
jgi:predicted AAA+ superfamily ATPase